MKLFKNNFVVKFVLALFIVGFILGILIYFNYKPDLSSYLNSFTNKL